MEYLYPTVKDGLKKMKRTQICEKIFHAHELSTCNQTHILLESCC